MLRLTMAALVISIFAAPALAENTKPSCAGYCSKWCQTNSQDRGYCINRCIVSCEAKRAGKK
jgi:hypothetical protein